MKTDTLIKLLKESGAFAWRITDTVTKGWEFYFIRHMLDQNRSKDIENIQITVFVLSEDGKSVGSATAEMGPDESEEYARLTIKDLIFQAGLVTDAYYELKGPGAEFAIEDEDIDINRISSDFIDMMKNIHEDDVTFMNSYEIFVSSIKRRIVTSTGIDVTEKYPVSLLETVVNAKDPSHEIEFYKLYDSGTCVKKDIGDDLSKTFACGRDRLDAEKTPSLDKADVVFSSEDAVRLYEFFKDGLDCAFIYMKYSPFEKGKEIADEVKGDRITLKALKNLPGSSQNRMTDDEGSPIYDEVLMKDNVPAAFHGGTKFSYYMGEKNTFIPGNYEVSGGTHSKEELLAGPVLECIFFSDFQVDTMSGDIFGEIRLAYLHEADGTVRPVTGGSVSGNLRELMKDMRMSTERSRYDNALIPSYTRLAGVTVTGAE
ncbi:MAG: TldD/PmbA family protein [Lachnospiraceae bacterium]|nr:TldD/PmbA family protein [Lachnospiraceae bacterium]